MMFDTVCSSHDPPYDECARAARFEFWGQCETVLVLALRPGPLPSNFSRSSGPSVKLWPQWTARQISGGARAPTILLWARAASEGSAVLTGLRLGRVVRARSRSLFADSTICNTNANMTHATSRQEERPVGPFSFNGGFSRRAGGRGSRRKRYFSISVKSVAYNAYKRII